MRKLALIAAVGAMIGAALALAGIPSALADVSHPAGTAGPGGTGVHLALDCDITTPEVDAACAVDPSAGQVRVGVTLGRLRAMSFSTAGLSLEVRNPDTTVLSAPPIPSPSPSLDGNPDANQAAMPVPAEWLCAAPDPDNDSEGDGYGSVPVDNPGTQHSFLSCDNTTIGGALIDVPRHPASHVRVADVVYDIAPGGISDVSLTLSPVAVTFIDGAAAEYWECNPIITSPMDCFGTTITVLYGPGCAGDHDCDGFGDARSYAHTGPANTNPLLDNCPATEANAPQGNYDGNHIDLPPAEPFDDRTRPRSDHLGDACDSDADNDGRLDTDELAGTACALGMIVTSPLDEDTDDDRVLDAAECALGFDPASGASVPPPMVLPDSDSDGAPNALDPNDMNVDSDGDGLRDGIELRSYNTALDHSNTDGDLCSDAKEVASINIDQTVNAADLQNVAAAFGMMTSPNYIVNYDTNKDGVINAIDLSFVAQRFGFC